MCSRDIKRVHNLCSRDIKRVHNMSSRDFKLVHNLCSRDIKWVQEAAASLIIYRIVGFNESGKAVAVNCLQPIYSLYLSHIQETNVCITLQVNQIIL